MSLDCREMLLENRRPGAAALVRMLAFMVKLDDASEAVLSKSLGVNLTGGGKKHRRASGTLRQILCPSMPLIDGMISTFSPLGPMLSRTAVTASGMTERVQAGMLRGRNWGSSAFTSAIAMTLSGSREVARERWPPHCLMYDRRASGNSRFLIHALCAFQIGTQIPRVRASLGRGLGGAIEKPEIKPRLHPVPSGNRSNVRGRSRGSDAKTPKSHYCIGGQQIIAM